MERGDLKFDLTKYRITQQKHSKALFEIYFKLDVNMMQIWCKYDMLLQEIEISFQESQKYSQKGHFEILFSYVRSISLS